MKSVTYQDVANAADKLLAGGKSPSAQAVHSVLGHGSMTTIHKHLKTWWGHLALRVKELERTPGLPDELLEPIKQLWVAAVNSARLELQREFDSNESKLNADRELMKERMAVADEARRAALAQLDVVREDREELRKEVENLRQRLSNTELSLATERQRNASTSQALQDSKTDLTDLRARFSRDQETWLKERQELSQRFDDVVATERHRFDEMEQRLVRQSDDWRRRYEDEAKAAVRLNEQVETLRERNQALQNQVSGKDAELAAARQEIGDYKEKFDELRSRLEHAERKLDDMGTSLRDVNADAAAKGERITALEKERSELMEKLARGKKPSRS